MKSYAFQLRDGIVTHIECENNVVPMAPDTYACQFGFWWYYRDAGQSMYTIKQTDVPKEILTYKLLLT